MPRPSSRRTLTPSSVAARSSTCGPMRTPRTSSTTTSGTLRRSTDPTASGASTAHTASQNSDWTVSGISSAPRPAAEGSGQRLGLQRVVLLGRDRPGVEQALGLGDLVGRRRSGRDLADVGLLVALGGLHSGDVALGHAPTT